MIEKRRDFCQLETFVAECAEAEVVVLKTALYGRMRIGRCVKRNYGHVGCAKDVLAATDRFCSGRLNACSFAVSSLHQYQPCPGDLTPYLEASYECRSGWPSQQLSLVWYFGFVSNCVAICLNLTNLRKICWLIN